MAAYNFSALAGKRIGVPRNNIYEVDNYTYPIIDAFNAALKALEAVGATIIDPTNYTALNAFFNSSTENHVLDVDFVADLSAYLAQLTYNPTGVKDLADVRAFTHAFQQEDWPDRDTAVWDQALNLTFNNTSPEFWSYYQDDLYFGGTDGLLGAIKNHSLDVIVIPTAFSSSISAIIGAPIVTVPLGAYPPNTTVVKNQRCDLVETAPNIPVRDFIRWCTLE